MTSGHWDDVGAGMTSGRRNDGFGPNSYYSDSIFHRDDSGIKCYVIDAWWDGCERINARLLLNKTEVIYETHF